MGNGFFGSAIKESFHFQKFLAIMDDCDPVFCFSFVSVFLILIDYLVYKFCRTVVYI